MSTRFHPPLCEAGSQPILLAQVQALIVGTSQKVARRFQGILSEISSADEKEVIYRSRLVVSALCEVEFPSRTGYHKVAATVTG